MLERLFPIAGQLRGYDRAALQGDLSAGLTVGVMLIPQGMAYALIAGVPPIYGLYAALVPLVVYALMGSSRQLAVGPVAMVSLLVAAGVSPLAEGDPERYVALTFTLAFMVGVLQAALGILRFGFLTNFLSHPVLAGFTSAAALIIGGSQLRHLVGVDLPGSAPLPEIVVSLLTRLGEVHLPTLVLGLLGIAVIVGLKRWRKTFPGALAVVVLGTLAVVLLGLDGQGVRTVGAIPAGLPAPTLPVLERDALLALLPTALTIALVGFMESIAVAKVYATRHRYPLDANQELRALGAANLAGAFFQAFPTTGGFSRTAVNDQAGARTTVASLVAAGVVALTLLFLTGLFERLPNAILAAIVMTAVASLFDWKEARHLWHVDRRDLAMMAITFGATLALGIEEGILAGVLVSLGALIYQNSRPHAAVCGRLPDSATFRDVRHHPEATCTPGVTVFRIDAPLTFANASFLRERVEALLEAEPPPRAFVFDFQAVGALDSTAGHALADLLAECRRRGVEPFFAAVKQTVRERMHRLHLDAALPPGRFFHEVAEAAEAAEALVYDAVPASPEPLADETAHA
ncbi:MAG: SulP family inorganic anion transporter [Rubricoccaceae bacterium]